jgi:hypothetical protein
MKKVTFKQVIGYLIFTFIISNVLLVKAQQPSFPYLKKQGTATQLMVNGKPFLIRGGELGNSSSSSAAYMKPHWEKLK